MSDILKIWLSSGKICAAVNYRRLWPVKLRLTVHVDDALIHEQAIYSASIGTRGDSREMIHTLPMPIAEILMAPSPAVEVKLWHRHQKASAEIKIRHCDRKRRPIVVCDRQPNGVRLNGWVVPKQDKTPRLSMFVDGRYVGSHKPTTQRRDILKRYPETAHVMNGYGFNIPKWCYDAQPHDVVIIEEASGIIADNCVMTLTPAMLRDGLIRRSNVLLEALSGQMYGDLK